jgi:hypothetical protein
LDFYFERAKNTIEVLNANMVKPEVPNKAFFEFYSDCTVMNVVKLLMRGKHLYEERQEAIKILKLVTEIEFIMRPR